MYYTFDDETIGLTENGTIINEPLISKISEMALNDWYRYAEHVCRLLNEYEKTWGNPDEE